MTEVNIYTKQKLEVGQVTQVTKQFPDGTLKKIEATVVADLSQDPRYNNNTIQGANGPEKRNTGEGYYTVDVKE